MRTPYNIHQQLYRNRGKTIREEMQRVWAHKDLACALHGTLWQVNADTRDNRWGQHAGAQILYYARGPKR